jgi:predicted acylesterase/phospholipase RssA
LGVLRAFEEAGIHFDQIAGTSIGALIGIVYAAGLSIDGILEFFDDTMQPPVGMRWLPLSKKWYLLALFRLGLLDRIFRRHLHHVNLDGLFLPVHTTTVDLVSAREIVRSSGDCVQAILESINHPAFGKPILRDGQMLVDGGVLVNVPSRTLRNHGCDFVVAVDVGTKLSMNFVGNTPGTPKSQMKKPGYLQTMLRVNDVQSQNLASIHAGDSDFLITPDTSAYSFDDFTNGNELADLGLDTARRAMPDLTRELESCFAGDSSKDPDEPDRVQSWLVPSAPQK